jgi:hypothetical protein
MYPKVLVSIRVRVLILYSSFDSSLKQKKI